MNITDKEIEQVKVIALEGSLDTNTSPIVQKHLDELVTAGTTRMIITFEKVDYVSSAGLRLLLATAKKLRSAGGELRVCTLNQVAQEVFDISGFSSILNVFNTESDALDGFS